MKNLKVILLILVSLLDELAIVVVLLLVLPLLGITIPLWSIVLIGLIAFAISIPVFRALRKHPQLGFENMVGTSGVAVTGLKPKGTVKISRELWSAKSESGPIEQGTKVEVTGQQGLLLTVKVIAGARGKVTQW